MKRSKTNRMHYRGILVILAAAAIVFFLGFFLGSRNMNKVEARDYVDVQKYYTEIEVEDGDTLWAIADEYMTEEYKDRDAFIDEVRQMNKITGSVICSGSTILVPYYR